MKKLYGVVVPVITPLDEQDRVDTAALAALCNFLIEKGVHCLYPCGTTGEMFNLSVEERKLVDRTVVETAAGRVPVYVQAGAMNQRDTIELAKNAEAIGADGIGVVTPGFFGLSEKALEEHYVAVANAVPNMPMYLYAIPQCAVNDISFEVADRAARRADNIIGIKYSYPNMPRIQQMTEIRDHSFSVLCGQDELLYSTLMFGGHGTVSGAANVIPEHYVAIYDAFQKGDLAAALKLQRKTNLLGALLNGVNNIARYKAMLPRLRGLTAGFMRAPGENLTTEAADQLQAQLEALQWQDPYAEILA